MTSLVDDQSGEIRAAGSRAPGGALQERGRRGRPEEVGERVPEDGEQGGNRELQQDNSSVRRFGGLGLGLSIVRHIVELHGGTVRAESPGKGQGATFSLTIPLLRESQDQAGKQVLSLAEAKPAAPELSHLRGLRVLVVPAIALTAAGGAMGREPSLDAGFQEYLENSGTTATSLAWQA
jgi:hypothetical protein